jgi:hypothetical protein
LSDDKLGDDFIGKLDEQAKALLQRLEDDSKLAGEQRLTVPDQTRAFLAVVNYAQARQKLAPPEKAKSKIAEMAERINGESPRAPRQPRRPAGVPIVNGHASDGGASGGGGPPAPEAPPFDPGPPSV